MEKRQRTQKSLPAEALSIFVFASAVFALVALITYHPGDPSFLSNAKGVAHNACGRVGAELVSVFLECFGMGAFLLPAALFFMAATIHRREGWVRLVATLGAMSIAVMSLTVFLALQWKYWPYGGSLLLTGGAFGAWVSEALLKELNPVGSSIVSLLIFVLALALSTPLSVAHMGARVLRAAGTLLWRLARLAATYAVYLVGLLAMRSAHAMGDFLQRQMEAAARRSRERAAEKARRKAIAATLEAQEKARALEAPIGGPLAHESLTSDTELALGSDGQPSEAPNALEDPDYEDQLPFPTPASEYAGASGLNGRLGSQAGPQSGPQSGPMILPRETAQHKLSKSAAPVSKKGNWKLPVMEFLRQPPKIESTIDKEKLRANSVILQQKFADFGIDGEVTAVRPGPVITLYEFKPGPGVKVSRIAALADDLSMALSAQSVRILAPLPGKSVVGIEIPSDTREIVFMREFLQHPDFYGAKHAIPVVMGKDIGGQTYLSDLARMPHLLCAGQTGAGKSVFMNGLICSLFYRFTPDELRMILVDPKFIEFRAYQDIPHLLLPVVDDAQQASTALKWAAREMDRRYRILAKIGARNLASFNQKVEEMGSAVVHDLLLAEDNQSENGPVTGPGSGTDWMEAFEPDEKGAPRVGKLPYIVIIIDELADLMMIAKKDVEHSIARIAQKARAAGIHLVIATQRPSTDVVTGLIKANLPSRVSFQLASYVDSKTILDRAGAERLLGQGDMLFIPPGVSQTLRLHGAFVDDDEISKITSFLKGQGKPFYRNEILIEDEEDDLDGDAADENDELFQAAVDEVRTAGHASASYLQRRLKVGYNRAARMIETMEARGIVGPADGARPREVLMR